MKKVKILQVTGENPQDPLGYREVQDEKLQIIGEEVKILQVTGGGQDPPGHVTGEEGQDPPGHR